MNITWNWTIFWIVIAISFVFWQVGLMTFWMCLAIAGIIFLFVLIQKIPAPVNKWVSFFFIVWLAIRFGPTALDSFLSGSPYVRPELGKRSLREDMRLGEYLHPSGLAQIAALKESSDRIEDKLGEEVSQELKNSESEYIRTGDFSAYQKRQDVIRNKIQKNISWREKNKEFISDTGGFSLAGVIGDKLPNVPDMNNLSGLSGEKLFWTIAIAVIILIIIAAAVKKLRVIAIVLIIVIGLLLALNQFASYYYHGGFQADVDAHQQLVASVHEVQKRKESLNPSPERRGHYNKPEPKVEGLAQKITVNLDPVHWSKKIPWSPDYNVKWDMPGKYEVMLSTGDRIINRNDGTTSSGLITYIESWGAQVSYPHSMEFRRAGEVRWFIVRGVAGTGTITISEQ
ncbi:MAG: hypothetical protein AAB394_02160 [Patescibacteria group bacterium]